MSDRLLKESDVLRIAFQLPLVVNSAFTNAVKALPSADIPQWIPCSERMPEESEWIGTKEFGTTISDEVLVTFESRGKRFVKPMHFQNGELGGMDKHTMDAFYGEWKVVAWMPLPEPWKGTDDDNNSK